MNKKKVYQKILSAILLLLVVICLVGCGGKDEKKEKNTEEQQSQVETDDEQELYMIMAHNTLDEFLTLRSFETGLELHYHYGFSTQFQDKYGTFTTTTEFIPGRIVTIGTIDQEGYLTKVQLSDEVWERKKIKHFSIDEEKGIFTIADTKYSIRDGAYIFSDEERISFSGISKDDVLTVIGNDKKILSVIVTTGHGTLSFTNTDLFENSLLQLNEDIFAMITKDMSMEVPEGTYTLTVANNGWGSSTEIEIKRGETTEVDLDTLKGEGPKRGLISFRIDVEDVEVSIDYELIDHTQPIELTYGTHILEIKAEGYHTWKKYLSVNSEEATIIIELEEDKAAEDSEDTEETEDTEESESAQESESESETVQNNRNTEDTVESEKDTNTESESTTISESESQTTSEEEILTPANAEPAQESESKQERVFDNVTNQ